MTDKITVHRGKNGFAVEHKEDGNQTFVIARTLDELFGRIRAEFGEPLLSLEDAAAELAWRTKQPSLVEEMIQERVEEAILGMREELERLQNDRKGIAGDRAESWQAHGPDGGAGRFVAEEPCGSADVHPDDDGPDDGAGIL